MMSLTTKPVNLPDGKYEAIWSGYDLKIKNGNKVVKAETTLGIRTINQKIKIQITGGLVEKAQDEA